MRRIKKGIIWITAFFITVLLGAVHASASNGSCGENITYTLENGVLTLSGTGTTVRYERNGETDRINTPWYDEKDQVTKLVVNEGITGLDNYLFYKFVNLSEVTLPESLERIESRVFKGCSALRSITLPKELSYIGLEAFAESGLTEVTFLQTFPPRASTTPPFAGVTATAYYGGNSEFLSAPYGGSLTWVALEETEPSKYSDPEFVDETIEAPEKEGSCGSGVYWAFRDGLLVIYGNGEMDKLTRNPDLDKVNQPWVDFADQIQRVVVNRGVTRINNYAFYKLKNLEEARIAPTVSAINYGAFSGCTKLKSLTVPSRVNEIGSRAFASSGFETIVFRGALPKNIGDLMTDELTVTIYYPCIEETVLPLETRVYGGNTTWEKAHEYINGVCMFCEAKEPVEEQGQESREPDESEEETAGSTLEEEKEKPVRRISWSALTVANLCLATVAVLAIILSFIIVLKLGKETKEDENE